MRKLKKVKVNNDNYYYYYQRRRHYNLPISLYFYSRKETGRNAGLITI